MRGLSLWLDRVHYAFRIPLLLCVELVDSQVASVEHLLNLLANAEQVLLDLFFFSVVLCFRELIFVGRNEVDLLRSDSLLVWKTAGFLDVFLLVHLASFHQVDVLVGVHEAVPFFCDATRKREKVLKVAKVVILKILLHFEQILTLIISFLLGFLVDLCVFPLQQPPLIGFLVFLKVNLFALVRKVQDVDCVGDYALLDLKVERRIGREARVLVDLDQPRL